MTDSDNHLTYNFLIYTITMNKKKKDVKHEHFANDDPTQFEHENLEELAKKAIKKFKSL